MKALAIALAIGFALTPVSSKAHTAPSGWVYPNACCRDHMDCQMISAQYIHFEKEHIRIEIPPGIHRHAPNGILKRLDYTDSTIRPSGDGDMHVCIGLYYDQGEPISTYRCLYITGGA